MVQVGVSNYVFVTGGVRSGRRIINCIIDGNNRLFASIGRSSGQRESRGRQLVSDSRCA